MTGDIVAGLRNVTQIDHQLSQIGRLYPGQVLPQHFRLFWAWYYWRLYGALQALAEAEAAQIPLAQAGAFTFWRSLTGTADLQPGLDHLFGYLLLHDGLVMLAPGIGPDRLPSIKTFMLTWYCNPNRPTLETE